MAKIDRTGYIERMAGSGRLRTARAAENVVVVEEMAAKKTSLAHIALYDRFLESQVSIGRASIAS